MCTPEKYEYLLQTHPEVQANFTWLTALSSLSSCHNFYPSLPSTFQRRCYFLAQMGTHLDRASMNRLEQDILLRLHRLALFSSLPHTHTVHRQDVHSFSHSLTHYLSILPNFTRRPQQTARDGTQTVSHRPHRPPYRYSSTRDPFMSCECPSNSFSCPYPPTDTNASKPA